MIIKNGTLLTDTFEFKQFDIAFEKTITDIGANLSGGVSFDATDCYVIPGLVDTHMHGAVGESFLEVKEGSASTICEFEAKNGTTTLVPALSAAVEEKMTAAIKDICAVAKKQEGEAKLLGIHLEGPFFSLKYKGAHLPKNIRTPDAQEFDRLYAASEGMVKIITMAPETENGIETVGHIAEKGVTVSVGHSDATYNEALAAFDAGATQTTHTFNAMSPLNHRNPGVVGGGMMRSDVTCELICDFFHVHPDVVKLLISIKGSDKVTMITDSEVGTGLPDGEYIVNGRTLTVRDQKTYTEDGTIAGGTSVLLDGVKNLVSIGIPLCEAVKMASKNGAIAAKIYDRVGSLAVGKDADILVLDRDLNLKAVFVNGVQL